MPQWGKGSQSPLLALTINASASGSQAAPTDQMNHGKKILLSMREMNQGLVCSKIWSMSWFVTIPSLDIKTNASALAHACMVAPWPHQSFYMIKKNPQSVALHEDTLSAFVI